MNRWLSIEFENSNDTLKFISELNKAITKQESKIYFKIFTPKAKYLKHKIFYIADEGSKVVNSLEKNFSLINCKPPERKLIARVAGFSADREWML